MTQAAQSRVFVDGNNVMGSRPNGWWRDQADAARRLVADVIPQQFSTCRNNSLPARETREMARF